jgi:hypothetical protein
VYLDHRGVLTQVPWVGSDQDQNAPDYLEFADDIEMVHHWSELGFVFNTGTPDQPRFVEVARRLCRDDGARAGNQFTTRSPSKPSPHGQR